MYSNHPTNSARPFNQANGYKMHKRKIRCFQESKGAVPSKTKNATSCRTKSKIMADFEQYILQEGVVDT